jgi:signal transduction histidine kinase
MSDGDPGKRTQRLERLLAIGRQLGTSMDLDALLKTVVDSICELTYSQGSSILLYEEETDLLKYVAARPTEKSNLKRIRVPLDNSFAGRVYTLSKPVAINNPASDPRAIYEVKCVLNLDIHSILAVPLVFRGETIGVIEAVNRRDNTHYTGEDVSILENLAGQAAVAILSTIMLDETKRAYEELEELERKKTDFIAIASHELRTPLGLILGHSSYLIDAIKDEQMRKQLEVIVRSANRLKKIIEDLSNVNVFYSGKGSLHNRSFTVEHLVKDVVANFQQEARRRKVNLITEFGKAGQVRIEGDCEKIALALNNLIDNALNFTNPNGHILISLEKLPGYVKISVIDDGIGIPPKDLARVFDRFFQVESHLTRRHGGMGLGLTVAKAMVEMHNGQIWVESLEGKGSNFSCLLPTQKEKDPRDALASEAGTLSKPFG